MIDANRELFDAFARIHDKYEMDDTAWQNEFNIHGKKVVEVIHEWEQRLCQKQSGGQYGKFSKNLSDKFWDVVRKDFPKIDFVGITIA